MSPENHIRSSVETISNPFRAEPEHRIMLAQTRQAMQQAGKQVEDLWSSFVAIGIQDVFQESQFRGRIVEFKAPDTAGIEAWYRAKYQYSGVDRLTQPVDVFHMIKEDPDKNDPPAIITVATYKGSNSRYTQLIALETEETAEVVPGHFFYFEGKDLVTMRQSAQPQTLFHSEWDKMQFFKISRKNIFGEETEFEVGILGGDGTTNHSYEHIGSGLVKTNRLRVADPYAGTIELIEISEEGIVGQPAAFNLPEAVANIGKFQPAIAA